MSTRKKTKKVFFKKILTKVSIDIWKKRNYGEIIPYSDAEKLTEI
jgi:hypothetical protein